jgi:hypothetical protein
MEILDNFIYKTMNKQDEFTNGRRKGCGACGVSESSELMQLTSIQPYDSQPIYISSAMYGEKDDIQTLLPMDLLLAEL